MTETATISLAEIRAWAEAEIAEDAPNGLESRHAREVLTLVEAVEATRRAQDVLCRFGISAQDRNNGIAHELHRALLPFDWPTGYALPADAHAATADESSTDNERGSASTQVDALSVQPTEKEPKR